LGWVSVWSIQLWVFSVQLPSKSVKVADFILPTFNFDIFD
jgi:hypothetical protein